MPVKSLAFLLLSAGAAQAACDGPTLRFVESAPRDRFELTVGAAALTAVAVDLRGSAGRLIFDTEDGGTGVEVFQPLRDEGGTQAGSVADGAEAVRVALRAATPGTRAAFSIDVDDRNTASDLGQIRVTGSEMAGARVTFEAADGSTLTARFDDSNRAVACP
ncbi:aggregation factor core [Sulfitobacter albidus]|uniref:Aggregation factor core n=1 Tax=Sulfitobacter albidus TaxID=2829501 RepID=A0A975PLE1_9RHOB|nr:aggregation factor core [Sulfitobacter albidus]QUJ75574.1 aggregation factor core [Sulfitobacter albidus]